VAAHGVDRRLVHGGHRRPDPRQRRPPRLGGPRRGGPRAQVDDFAYANLAVRGKLIGQIVADQIEPALALAPDLVTFSAGGNDVIRPGGDPDAVAVQFEDAVARLSSQGATVVVFTGIDTEFTPVFRIRGRVAIYNENIRAIADRYDCIGRSVGAQRGAGRAVLR
jgi:lysophospholipase L1-like esterase